MILRATVASVKDAYHCTVRIPQFNKIKDALGATPDSELYTAVIACNSGIQPIIKSGDVVIVAFESGIESQPCVIGLLFNEKSLKSKSDASFTSLDVSVNAKFAEDVTIGEVSKDNIKCLEKLERNVQTEFESIDQELETKTKQITSLTSRAKLLEDVTQQHTIEISQNAANIQTLQTDLLSTNQKVSQNTTDIKNVTSSFNAHKANNDIHVTTSDKNYWNSKAEGSHRHSRNDIDGIGTIILDSNSYGTDLPAGGVQGQLYFKIN